MPSNFVFKNLHIGTIVITYTYVRPSVAIPSQTEINVETRASEIQTEANLHTSATKTPLKLKYYFNFKTTYYFT